MEQAPPYQIQWFLFAGTNLEVGSSPSIYSVSISDPLTTFKKTASTDLIASLITLFEGRTTYFSHLISAYFILFIIFIGVENALLLDERELFLDVCGYILWYLLKIFFYRFFQIFFFMLWVIKFMKSSRVSFVKSWEKIVENVSISASVSLWTFIH